MVHLTDSTGAGGTARQRSLLAHAHAGSGDDAGGSAATPTGSHRRKSSTLVAGGADFVVDSGEDEAGSLAHHLLPGAKSSSVPILPDVYAALPSGDRRPGNVRGVTVVTRQVRGDAQHGSAATLPGARPAAATSKRGGSRHRYKKSYQQSLTAYAAPLGCVARAACATDCLRAGALPCPCAHCLGGSQACAVAPAPQAPTRPRNSSVQPGKQVTFHVRACASKCRAAGPQWQSHGGGAGERGVVGTRRSVNSEVPSHSSGQCNSTAFLRRVSYSALARCRHAVLERQVHGPCWAFPAGCSGARAARDTAARAARTPGSEGRA